MGKKTKGSSLPAELVIYLTNQVIEQFYHEYFSNNKAVYEYTNDASLFGFGNYDKDDAENIRTYLLSNHNVIDIIQKYIKDKFLEEKDVRKYISGNYLWKKNHEAKQLPEKSLVSFKPYYRDVFLQYINKDLKTLSEERLTSYTYFVGFYMSFVDFKIKTLLFQISKKADFKERRELYVEGVHAKQNATIEEQYRGKVWNKNGQFYGYALGEDSERRLSLMGAVKNQAGFEQNKYIKIFLQGITFDEDRFFSWEVFLCEISKQKLDEYRNPQFDASGPVNPKLIEDEDYKFLSLYLILHRNVMTFETTLVGNIQEDLVAKGTQIGGLVHLQGTYRLWNFDFELERIIQSKFSILDGSIGCLETIVPPKQRSKPAGKFLRVEDKAWQQPVVQTLQVQNALINISKANENLQVHKIVVVTFNGIDIVNVAMFDFPVTRIVFRETVIAGSFSTLSDQLHGNISGYFVMIKDDKDAIDVKSMDIDTAFSFAKDKHLLHLLNALVDITKTNQRTPIIRMSDKLDDLESQVKSEVVANLNIKNSLSSNLEDEGKFGYNY